MPLLAPTNVSHNAEMRLYEEFPFIFDMLISILGFLERLYCTPYCLLFVTVI